MFELTGKVAWVTGSARNLGKAMVEDFAEQGADVVVSNKSNTEELDQTVSELRRDYDVNVRGVQLDISDSTSVHETVQTIEDELGTVDILVNNVAIRPHDALDSMTVDDWETVLNVNLTGTFNCTTEVLPGMIDAQWGRVICISGLDAFTGSTNRIHNVTAKAGIIGFTRALANEAAEDNITANCVVPGTFDTTRESEKYPELEYRYVMRRLQTPLNRLGDPKELSPAVVFLASKEASFITGQVLHVNGGRYPTFRDHETISRETVKELYEKFPDTLPT